VPAVLARRFSDCLDFYDSERALAGDDSLPTLHQLIEWLGGAKLMERIRTEKTASERYRRRWPRMRRLLEQCADGTLHDQIARFSSAWRCRARTAPIRSGGA